MSRVMGYSYVAVFDGLCRTDFKYIENIAPIGEILLWALCFAAWKVKPSYLPLMTLSIKLQLFKLFDFLEMFLYKPRVEQSQVF